MEELFYWTNRVMDKGKVACWVYRQDCPKCKKAQMGKPQRDNGAVMIRAKEFTCPSCSYTVPKEEYEATLEAQVDLTCPSCEKHSELVVPFKRKNILGVLTLRVQCPSCKGNVDITKKMKAPKKKKSKAAAEDEVPDDDE